MRNPFRRRLPTLDLGARVTVGGEEFEITEVSVTHDATGAIVQLGCERPGAARRRSARPAPEPSSWWDDATWSDGSKIT